MKLDKKNYSDIRRLWKNWELLPGMRYLLNLECRKNLMRAFTESNIKYYHLILVLFGRKSNDTKNKRFLRSSQ